FAPDTVRKLAEKLASRPFVKPVIEVPEPFNKLTYDQYRDIRFRVEQSLWRQERLDFEIQMFPMGFLYNTPVDIWSVEAGKARQLKADGRLFGLGPLIAKGPDAAPFAFSGLRVHGPINRSDYYDEYAVFQGASYFRAVGRSQHYGMSARGLAINTARPGGEEFPLFRSFWIEKPQAGSTGIVIHALLDSPSTTGAYRFTISPGPATVMDVEAVLFPRQQIIHLGLAPLTSMFLHGAAHRRINGDFRPAVHDSEGLALLNGKGERLWRPLTNPKKLQTSAFLDRDPKGFGLSQRDRNFRNFQDLEAKYGDRPTVWVEPKGSWGEGYVELIEIPAEEEIHDNIVAYWKPAKPLEPDKSHTFAYRLHWTDMVPVAWPGARVQKTLVGSSRKPGTQLFVIDFDGPAVKEARDLPVAEISASAGSLANVVVQRNPEISGLRVTFELNTGGVELIELRLGLKSNDQLISESWLYRWTRV
ncbi:MAG: glucan biosynthesis protein D, partial [Hyphomicrobium sp.]|nr:glucan biosynthesis protein D [Hyphomicrobium sp.]